MSRMGDAGTASLRSVLMVVLGGAVALLMPSLFTTAVDAPSSVVLAAVAAMAVAAVMASSCRLVTFATPPPMPRHRDADHVTTVLRGLATDPVHHPLRPRAPGLA